jgi:hypothetical protein
MASHARANRSPNHSILFDAVNAQRISLIVVTGHRTVWTPRQIRSAKPAVVLLNDDNPAAGPARDPAEWRCGISVMAWARSVLVHGAAASPAEYIAAVMMAEKCGRVLIVETDSACAPVWAAAALPRGVPTLTIIPPGGGGVHPVLASVL